MARTESLRIGDSVVFFDKVCTVVEMSKGSEIIAVRCRGSKGFLSYIHAKDCKKLGT